MIHLCDWLRIARQTYLTLPLHFPIFCRNTADSSSTDRYGESEERPATYGLLTWVYRENFRRTTAASHNEIPVHL
jgi:hypothetical protein